MAAAFFTAASTLLSPSRFLLADVRAHPLLDELECALVLRHFEQPHGKAVRLLDHVWQELGVLGEAQAVPAGRVSC